MTAALPSESRRFIRAHDLIAPGRRGRCLVSGGADSTCLWHVLGSLGYRVSAVHVNHGLRGDESEDDARFCRELMDAEVIDGAGSQACPRPSTEAELARAPLLADRGAWAARDRPHGLGSGRDDPLSARLVRQQQGDQAGARGRRRPSAALALAGGDGGVLPRARPDLPSRLLQPGHEAGPDPRRDPPAPPAPASGRRPEPACRSPRSAPACRGRSSGRSRSCSPRRAGTKSADLGAGIRAVREYDTVRLEGRVSFGPWRLESDVPGLVVRTRRPGDRLAGRRKKVQDLFVDAKVPRAERDAWPLVVSGDEVVAVPGIAEAPGWEGIVRAWKDASDDSG